MFSKILIANRGEIARRVIRSARRMGIASVAVYSEADELGAHVAEADESFVIGPAPAAQSYLCGDAIIAAARAAGAEAIHPGYGFLSENATFAEAVIAAGLIWIGPPPAIMRMLGDKARAREAMRLGGFPVNPGGPVSTIADAVCLAETCGYPAIIKAAAGGGGIGMSIVRSHDELAEKCQRTMDLGRRFFGDGSLLIERFLERARHVELQVLGLTDGQVVVLGERDCSVQRRFQKVVEESPSPALNESVRASMIMLASRALARLGYLNAGTVECLVQDDEFVFLEVNARLQVEHPVTEMVTGIDLVEAQFKIAAGELCGLEAGPPSPKGHAIELRVYAEDPIKFLPRPGRITLWEEPVGSHIRVDAAYRSGDVVTSYYDPLLAKLILWGENRAAALTKAREAIAKFKVEGVQTNLPFLARVLDDVEFASGTYDTGLITRLQARADA